MRKVTVLSFLTLDGVMQAPGGAEEDTSGGFQYGGWIPPHSDEVSRTLMADQMAQPFSLLLGRKTYDIFAGYWPQNESRWPGINAATKYVASHDASLPLAWKNAVLITGDVAEEVRRIKTQDGPDLHVYGSGNFVQTLLKHDLVDELWLKIFPVTLGQGKRLFAEGTLPAAFTLTSSTITPKGVIFANYARNGAVKTGAF